MGPGSVTRAAWWSVRQMCEEIWSPQIWSPDLVTIFGHKFGHQIWSQIWSPHLVTNLVTTFGHHMRGVVTCQENVWTHLITINVDQNITNTNPTNLEQIWLTNRSLQSKKSQRYREKFQIYFLPWSISLWLTSFSSYHSFRLHDKHSYNHFWFSFLSFTFL